MTDLQSDKIQITREITNKRKDFIISDAKKHQDMTIPVSVNTLQMFRIKTKDSAAFIPRLDPKRAQESHHLTLKISNFLRIL